MGRGITEITQADLHSVVGTYYNVVYMNDPTDTDLIKTISGQPRALVINLGQLLNIASGDIQGDAIAIDELEATEIADDAVRGRELAETPSLFQTATEVTHDHDTGDAHTILAANSPGEGDRLVLVQCEVTETFASTSWELQVGSSGDPNGLFADIFAGLATLQINETVVGAYLLPEAEALVVTETSMVGDSTGQLTFRLVVAAPAAGSIPGALLADDAVGDYATSTTVGVAHSEGPTKELLAAHATDDRLVLVMGVATETAVGEPDIDVGSAVTAINAAFDDIAAGAWVFGERWQGACMLPAGEALIATISVAGTAGEIDFHVIPLTVVPSGTVNLFVGGTEVEQDHTDGTRELLAANVAGQGDRLLIVQAECTEAFVAASYDIDVGSVASSTGLFNNIFGGDVALAIGESVIGVYLLPEAEALTLTENDMTTDSAGKIMFRINVVAPAAGSIPGALLADNAIGDFHTSTTVNVADTEGPTKQLLAAHATNDRVVLVLGVATVSASGTPDFDVGSDTTAINSVFDDIESGAWVVGERWMGACMLPAGEDLIATLTAGTGGAIDFHIISLTVPTASAQNLFEDGTEVEQDHGGGATELLAANAAGGGDRLVIVQAEVTEAWAGTSWDYNVGSATTPNGLFDDIFGSPVPLAIGTSVIGAYLLPEGEALATVEVDMTAITDGKIMFRTLVSTPAAGSIPGNLLANDGVNFPYGVAPTAVVHDGGNVELLASSGTLDRIVLVTAIITESGDGTVDIDVGAGAGTEVFSDLALGDFVIGERYFGAMVLASGSALNATIVTAGGSGEIDFYVTVLTPTVQNAQIIDGAVDTAELADAAVTGLKLAAVCNLFDAASAAVTVIVRNWVDGDAWQLLAANAATAGDRLILVQAHVTELFDLDSFDWDVGSATDPNGLFDDLFTGLETIGLRESEMSAYILPAGEALVLTEVGQVDGGTPAGEVTFSILDLGAITAGRIADAAVTGIKLAATPSLFEHATDFTQDHGDGSQNILAANAAGGGDRLVIVQAEVTEAWAGTSWEWDVGSTADTAGLFDDIFSSPVPLALGETVVGSYLLPEGEALAVLENDMTMTTGKILFRILINTPAAGSIPGALLADDAVGLFENITPTAVAFGGAATQQLLASDATSNRHVLVLAIAQVAATGCDWDVGAGAGAEVFDDISDGTWIAGERWMGACDLAAGDALNVTLQTAGSAGEIDFYVIALTPLVLAANIDDDAVTDAKILSQIVKEPGRIAGGRADFAGVATPAITVTVGAVVFQEADAEDFPNGVWTNGGTANTSAVSLAAAINGDTRSGGTYAAVVLTDTVFIFARAVGAAGNVNIVVSAGEPAAVEHLVDGADAAVKEMVTIMHTVTALEVAVAGAAPQVLIPLPFDPTYFQWQVYDSTGGIYAVEMTGRGTITGAAGSVPAYFKLADNAAVDVQAGDIIRLIAVE